MYYEKYCISLKKLNNTIDKLERLTDRKEQLFEMTQPGATAPGVIRGTAPHNKIDDYIIRIEEDNIDSKIEEASKAVEYRRRMCKERLRDLERSKELIDRIYYLAYVQFKNLDEICEETGYSRTQIHRYKTKIHKTIGEQDER